METKMYFGIKVISISEYGITLKFQDELKIFLSDMLLHKIAEKHNSPYGKDICPVCGCRALIPAYTLGTQRRLYQ